MAIYYKVNVLDLLKDKGYTTYSLRKKKLLAQSTMQKLRDSVLPSWNELDRLCELLDMQPGDILGYIPNRNNSEDDSHVEYVVHTTYERKGLHKVAVNEYVPVVRTEQQTSSGNEATADKEATDEKVKSMEDSLKELEALRARYEESLNSLKGLEEEYKGLIGGDESDSSDENKK